MMCDPFTTALFTVRNIVHAAMDYAIVDVDYEELEPDPADGPAPMATLVSSPKK